MDDTVEEIYNSNELNAKKYIRDNIKNDLVDEYNGPLVENIIFEIFDDRNMNMTRISTEITNYQRTKLNKKFKEFEVSLIPDKNDGIGIN